MREPTLLILVALAEQPRHGYGIIRRIEDVSDGRVVLGAGTLYGALDRLEEEGWITLDREEVESGRLRRYYRITGTGRDELRAELARLEADAALARAALSRPAEGMA